MIERWVFVLGKCQKLLPLSPSTKQTQLLLESLGPLYAERVWDRQTGFKLSIPGTESGTVSEMDR